MRNKILIVSGILLFLIGGFFGWQCIFESGKKGPAENYCDTDEDCACGADKITGNCFYGNKEYVDTARQCPDFCTGIGGNLEIKCNNHKCEQVPRQITENPDPTANWKIYRNEEYGFEFKYPENFGANVWRPYFWPPKATVVVEEDPIAKGCPDFPSGYQNIITKNVGINGIDFVIHKASDGAAGSSYISYCYVAEKDMKYYVVNFLIRTTNGCGENCGPYCGTQYEQECLNFNFSEDVEKPIEAIMSTFRFDK
jgi:hypothetical protein